jgi:hypothetical protein
VIRRILLSVLLLVTLSVVFAPGKATAAIGCGEYARGMPIGSTGLKLPANSGKGRRVVIQQDSKHVWLVGSNGKVVADQPVTDNPKKLSVGKYFITTDPYSFEEVAKPWGKIKLWHFQGFASEGDIGFHLIPAYVGGKNDGCLVQKESQLGSKKGLSGGCIRVSQWFKRQLDTFAKPYTKVVVI